MPTVGPHPSAQPACARPDLRSRLAEWDSLEPRELAVLESHAVGCSVCGRELELLRAADAWLAGLAPEGSAGPCPDPELLYAAAGGPGAEPMAEPQRSAVREHLARCSECAGFAATLRSRPPSPLVLEPEPSERSVRPLRPLRRTPRLLVASVAAAAGLLVALALWRGLSSPAAVEGAPVAGVPRFPGAPLLRGDQAGPLHYPRLAVLAREGGELFSPLEFELEPQDGASAYRVELSSADGGERVLAVEGPAPRLDAAERQLAPGRYTWEAWAVVRGLDVPLGRRDFEVALDPRTLAELAEIVLRPEPERSERALALLVERGFESDARAWARALPASPERDAFLGRSPGR